MENTIFIIIANNNLFLIMMLLIYYQDAMLDKMNTLKNSLKKIKEEMEKTSSIISALAIKSGLDEVEEEDN